MVILALNATKRHNVMRLHHSVLSSNRFRGVILIFCRRKQWAKMIIVNKSSLLWSTVKQVHAGLRHVRVRALLMSTLPGRAGGNLELQDLFFPPTVHLPDEQHKIQTTGKKALKKNVRRIITDVMPAKRLNGNFQCKKKKNCVLIHQ